MRSILSKPRSGRALGRRTRTVAVAGVALASLAVAVPANASWGGPTKTHGSGLGTVPAGNVSNNMVPTAATTNGDVLASVYSGGHVFIGGSFTQVNGQPAAHLAELDASGNLIGSWTGQADDGAVNALAVSPDGTKLYVGGNFTTLDGGSAAQHFGALSTATGGILSWTGTTPYTSIVGSTGNGYVYSLVATQSTVYLGGNFTKVNNTAAGHLVALDATTGNIVAGWSASVDNSGYTPTPATDGRITSLALSSDGSRLFIGGYFSHVNGAAHPSLAALNSHTGALITGFAPYGLNSAVGNEANTPLALVSTPTHLYVAIGGRQNWLLDYNPVTGGQTRFFTRADGDFQALALIGGKLYAGGHFYQYVVNPDGVYHYGGVTLNGYVIQTQFAMRFDATTGVFDPSWQPGVGQHGDTGANYGVWTMATDGRNLYLGGAFDKASSQPHPHFALFRG